MTAETPPLALDTNILVRLLVEDDPAQARRARETVTRGVRDAEGKAAFFVPGVAVCELVWVLESRYRFSRIEIASALRGLLLARGLEVEDGVAARAALERYEAGRGDYADYLMREAARRAGCPVVLTFDRHLLREEGFRAP